MNSFFKVYMFYVLGIFFTCMMKFHVIKFPFHLTPGGRWDHQSYPHVL